MNYNPYQAPQAAPGELVPGGAVVAQGSQPWAVGEAIELAWEGFKRCWLALAASFFIDRKSVV